MKYDSYKKKAISFVNFLNLMKKHLALVITLAIFSAATIFGVSYSYGMIVDDIDTPTNIVYGENYGFNSKVAMGNAVYEYRRLGESEWTEIQPNTPGEYEVRVKTHRAFGIVQYGKINKITIDNKKIDVVANKNEIMYGDKLSSDLALENGDTLNNIEFTFNRIGVNRLKVQPIEKSIEIVDKEGKNVSNYYDFNIIESELGLIKRKIDISSNSETKFYDGTPLTCEEYTVGGAGLVFNDTIDIKFYNSVTTVGKAINDFTVTIKDKDGIDVSERYDINSLFGELEVEKRPILIKSEYENRTYDGTPFKSSKFTTENLVEGERVELVETTEIIDVGKTTNTIKCKIYSDEIETTDNYDITYEYDEIEILPREITITTSSSTKIYDGLELVDKKYELNGTLAEGHNIKVDFLSSIVDVGKTENVIDVEITDSNDLIVNDNYDITIVFGTLQVDLRKLTVTTEGFIKTYDGVELKKDSYVLSNGENEGLAPNQIFVVTSEYNGITNVGTINNSITYVIQDANGVDTTKNYDILEVFGDLTVNIREIEITSLSKEWIYDDTDHSYLEYSILEGENIGLPIGERIEVVEYSTIRDVIREKVVEGEQKEEKEVIKGIPNELKIKIYHNDTESTLNYKITYKYDGIIKILPRPLKLTTNSNEKVYDATPLKDENYVIEKGENQGLVLGHEIYIISEWKSIVDAGTIDNVIEYEIVNELSDSTIANYDITNIWGKLVVHKRNIDISTNSHERVYDGTPLSDNTINVVEGENIGLVIGHKIVVTSEWLSITNVFDKGNGVKNNNSFEFIICDSLDLEHKIDLSKNYEIKTEFGTLNILQRDIEITSPSGEWIYDGLEHFNIEYVITKGENVGLVEGETINVTKYPKVKDVLRNELDEVISKQNILEIEIYKEEVDVSRNYNIIYNNIGTLTIIPRALTIKTNSHEKVYDSTPLFDHKIITNNGKDVGLVSGQEIVVTSEWLSITNVFDKGNGVKNNNSFTYIICEETDTEHKVDLTKNYEITTEFGTLTITPRPVTVSTNSKEKIYDAKPLYDNKIITNKDKDAGLVLGQGIVVTSEWLSITNVFDVKNGVEHNNSITFIICNNQDLEHKFDLTKNYDITTNFGTLTVKVRDLTIKTNSHEKVYDSKPLFDYTINTNKGDNIGLVLGQKIVVTSEWLSITNVYDKNNGVKNNNSFTFKIYDKTDVKQELELTQNYNITTDFGTLTVLVRPLTIKTNSHEKIYDGKPLSDQKIITNKGDNIGLVLGQEIIVTSKWLSITNVFDKGNGVKNNNSFTYKICDSKDSKQNDLSKNYEVSTDFGTLSVLVRPLTIKTNSHEKVYDGKPLFDDGIITNKGDNIGLVSGQEIVVTSEWLSITNVYDKNNGVKNNNSFTFEIYDKLDEKQSLKLTRNYSITTDFGTLTVTIRDIEITSADGTWIYDGEDHFNVEYKITQGENVGKAERDTIEITKYTKIQDVQRNNLDEVISVKNELEIKIKFNLEDVSKNYNIIYQNIGKLTINPKLINLLTGSKEKIYDGKILEDNTIKIVAGGVANKQKVVALKWIKFADVFDELNNKEKNNVIEFGIYREDDVTHATDLIKNYDMTIEYGTLKILARNIEITSQDGSWVYDGLEHSNTECKITKGENVGLINGDLIEVTKYPKVKNVLRDESSKVLSVANILEIKIVNGKKDVSLNYNITCVNVGMLLIIPRPLTVTTETKSKVYDGTPLVNQMIQTNQGGIAPNQELFVTSKLLSITNVFDKGNGEPNNNTIEFIICDKKDLEHKTDLSSNYEITKNFGTLTVTKRDIEIITQGGSWVYDGVEHFNIEYMLGSTSKVVAGETIKITSYTKVQNVQKNELGEVISSKNELKIAIYKGKEDNSENYNIIYKNIGELTITPREIILKTEGAEQWYNGKELKSEKYLLENKDKNLKPLAEGQTFVITSLFKSITNVGEIKNSITYLIKTKQGEDVTKNYNIEEQFGMLKIYAIDLNISTSSDSKVYDGTPLQNNNIIKDADLMPGFELKGENPWPSITNVWEGTNGQVTNENNIIVIDTNGEDVTNNFTLHVTYGTLTITKRQITITSISKNWTYDGKAHSHTECTISNPGLAETDSISNYVGATTITNVKRNLNNQKVENVSNEFTVELTTTNVYENHNVIENYDIRYEYGYLRIDPRKVEYTTGSDTKIYDGKPLYKKEVTQIIENNDGLLESHEFVVNKWTEVTDAKSWANLINYDIVDKISRESVKENYDVNLTCGTLLITKREIAIKTDSDEKAYDNKPLKCESYKITKGSLADGDSIQTSNWAYLDTVGSIDNRCDITIKNTTKEVLDNYDITLAYGTLEIKIKKFTIITEDENKVYDGTPLVGSKYHTNPEIDRLPNGDNLIVEFTSSITEPGSVANTATFKVVDINGKDVTTSKYEINIEYGTLTIREDNTVKTIIVKPKDERRSYDGTPLFATEIVEDSTLIELKNQGFDYEVTFYEISITNVGTEKSRIKTFKLFKDGLDVTKDFNIQKKPGTLEITKKEITIDTGGVQNRTYDGTALKYEYFNPNNDQLIAGHEIIVKANSWASITDVGDEPNNAKFSIIESSTKADKTRNYSISVSGLLRVEPIIINVETESKTRVYDGTSWSNAIYHHDQVAMLQGKFLVKEKRQWIQVKNYGTYTNDNDFMLYDLDLNPIKPKNYVMIVTPGILNVTQRELVISTNTESKTYDGKSLFDHTINTNKGEEVGLVEWEKIVTSNWYSVTNVFDLNNGKTNNNKFDFKIYDSEDKKCENDLSENYKITTVWGTLEILPRSLTIRTFDKKQIYNATPISNTKIMTNEGVDIGLVEGQEIVLTSKWKEITNVFDESNGVEHNNSFTYKICDKNDIEHVTDLCENYNIAEEFGTLTVSKRPISISTNSHEKVYDGKPLFDYTINTYINENLGLVEGQEIVLTSEWKEITNVFDESNGIIHNNSFTYKICDKKDIEHVIDLCENYNVTEDFGTLKVNKRPISISTNSHEKVYDGTPLSDGTINLEEGTLAEGECIDSISSKSIINVFDKGNNELNNNIVEIGIYKEVDIEKHNNLAENYVITTKFGTLRVTPRSIDISSQDGTWEYDGLDHFNKEPIYKEGENIGLAQRDTIKVIKYTIVNDVIRGKQDEVLSVGNELIIEIWFEEEDVSKNYIIKYNYSGKLKVTPIKLEVSTNTREKTYDGKPLFDKELYINKGALAENQEFAIISYTKILDVFDKINSIPNNNVVTFAIYSIDDLYHEKDLIKNYDIKITYGTFTINKRDITITSPDGTWIYDGLDHFNIKYKYKEGELVQGEKIDVSKYTIIKEVLRNKENKVLGKANELEIVIYRQKEDISKNYNIIYNNIGILTINPRNLIISTNSISRVYDGTPLFDHTIKTNDDIDTGIVKGQVIVVISKWLEITNVFDKGNKELHNNSFEFMICDFLDKDHKFDLKNNYDITTNFGTLEVTPRSIEITSQGGTWVYDGLDHFNKEPIYKEGENIGLAHRDTIKVTKYSIIKEVLRSKTNEVIGIYNELKIKIYYLEDDVSGNYKITYKNSGILKIKPRPITITTSTIERVYDGTPLYDHTIKTNDSKDTGLALGQEIFVTSDWISVTNVLDEINGVLHNNSIEFIIYDSKDSEQKTDLSKNYEIKTEFGTLTVLKRDIELTTQSQKFIYDGVEHFYKVYISPRGKYDGVIDGEEIVIVDYTTIRDVLWETINEEKFIGSVNNILKIKLFRGDEDVSSNYNIIYHYYGYLTIIPRKITVTTGSDKKIYDGKPLSAETIEGNTGKDVGLIYNHFIKTTGKWVSITNVDLVDNIIDFKIVNEKDEDVTPNYDITPIWGTLEVIPIDLILTTSSITKTYTGKVISCKDYKLQGKILTTHKFIIGEDWTEEINYGEYTNKVSCKIVNDKNEDVTKNYKIKAEWGTITINQRVLYLSTNGKEKEYDGIILKDENYYIKDADINTGIVKGQSFKKTSEYVSIIEPGKITNEFKFDIVSDKDGSSVIDNYKVNCTWGELIVNRIKMSISTGSSQKKYDGNPLTYNRYKYDKSKLLENHRIEITVTGSQIEIGQSHNTYECIIIDNENQDVTRFYEFINNLGILKVIDPNSLNGEDEDGGKLDQSGNISQGGNSSQEGDMEGGFGDGKGGVIFKYTSNQNGRIYFRVKSFGDYHQNGWGEPLKYPDCVELNPLYFTSLALQAKNYPIYDVHFNITNRSNYQLPYYTINGPMLDNDFSNDINFESDYSLNYISYEYNNEDNISVPDNYKQAENRYYNFVMANYLELPQSTLKGMLEIINNNNIDRNSPTIINDVANYIQNAATYDGGFKKIPEGKDTALYFLNESKSGICQHFATAAVCMYRALGIPARYTIGYASHSVAGMEIPVSSFEAHAWVEVYIKGFGWVNVEVTGAGAFDNEDAKPDPNKNDLIIKPIYQYKEYDGTPLVANNEIEMSNMLYELQNKGFKWDVATAGSITEIGSAVSKVTKFILYDSSGKDVTKDYNVIFVPGELVVLPNTIVIKSGDAKKEYDGKPLTCETTEIISSGFGLRPNHQIKVTSNWLSITEIGKKLNEFSCIIVNELGEDVSNLYNIQYQFGTLEVTKKHVTITTASAKKKYDGTPLEAKDSSIDLQNPVENHRIIVDVTGSIIDIGKVDNTCEIHIVDENQQDVSDMYIVDVQLGVLEIVDKDVEGDGTKLDDSGDLSNKGDGSSGLGGGTGDALFTFVSGYQGSVYFRVKSFGNYTGQGWETPINGYNEAMGDISPLYFSAFALQQQVSKEYDITINLPAAMNYLLPYNTINGPKYSSDFDNSNEFNGSYSLKFIPYEYSYMDFITLENSKYDKLEKAYRKFVYDNYLSLPESTKLGLLDIAKKHKLYKTSPSVIQDVADYIKGAATYNLNFKEFPQNEDIVLYFLNKSKEGICQHFASAAVCMYRALGIPARYTIGFSKESNANKKTKVGSLDAHAWVEVYIDGMGWVNIEATGSGYSGFENDGDLKPNVKVLNIKPIDVIKEYTGEIHYAVNKLDEKFDTQLKDLIDKGYTYEVICKGEQRDYGESDIEIVEFHLFDQDGVEVTDNYEYIYTPGKISVTKQQIFFYVKSYTKLYDGRGLTYTKDDVFIKVPEGLTIDFNINGSVSKYGTAKSELTDIRVTNSAGEDVTDNYYFNIKDGMLTINKVKIQITTEGAEKYYDGTALTNDKWYISQGELLQGHHMEVELSGSIIDIGTEKNTVKNIVIYDENGNDVTDCYIVDYKDTLGDLVILG